VPGVLTVDPATLLYTATPVTVTFGSTFPAFGGTVAGFVDGDTLASATTGTAVFTTPAAQGSAAGSYAIDGAGLTAPNYVFAQAASNASALIVANPDFVVSRPIVVGGTSTPAPVLGTDTTPAGTGGTVGVALSDSAAGAPLLNVVTVLVPSPGQGSGGTVDINSELPAGSGQLETSVVTGDFEVVYQTDYQDGQETRNGFAGGLDYASSFTIFDKRDHPTSRVRHSSG